MKFKELLEAMTTKPKDYTERKNGGDYIYNFEIGENKYEVIFGSDGVIELSNDDLVVKPYEITFGLKSDDKVLMNKTNTGNANVVFATVYDILNKFINSKKPDVIYFSSIKDIKDKDSRKMLYRRSLRNINNNNYWTKVISLDSNEEYYVILNKNKIEENKENEKEIYKIVMG